MIRKEDGVPAIGLVFCPHDPSPDLKIPQPSFSFFDIGFQDISRIFVFPATEVKILSQGSCKIPDLSVKYLFGKEIIKIAEEFIFSIKITSVDQACLDLQIGLGHFYAFGD